MKFSSHNKRLLSCITFGLIYLIGTQVCLAYQLDTTYSKQISDLNELKVDIQKKASIILQIAQNADKLSFDEKVYTTPYLRIINSGCGIFENQFDSDFPILSPNINDEFKLIQQDDNWFQIQLTDGREAWVEQDCIQRFEKSSQKNLGKLRTMTIKSDQVKLATYAFEELNVIAEEAEKKSQRIKANKRTSFDELKQLQILNGQINRYKSLAVSAYYQYIVPETNIVNYIDIIDRVSVLAELQLGISDFTMIQNEFSQVSQKGLIGDFILDATYKIDQKSKANILFSNASDIIQTPYTNSTVEARYESTFQKLNWSSAISYNRYNDNLNTFNKYRRFGVNLGASQKINQKTTLRFDYLLNANKYTDFSGINFTNHSANFNTRTVFSNMKSLDFSIRTNAQLGEEERRNFVLLYPELKYNLRKQSSTLQYFANYQKYSFSNLGLRDTDRLMVGIRSIKQMSSKSVSKYLGLSAKVFQNKPSYNYYQIDTRFSSNWINRQSMFTNLGIRVNFYPSQTNLNFSDIQFSFGNSSRIFYNFSTFNRFYFASEPLINILDVNLRAGLSLKTFRFGPSISVHALMNAEQFEIKQDGNFYRFGAYAEGNIALPYQINISLVSAYDYGYVYSQQFSQNNSTGELSYGDVNDRHPTTFQLNSTISTSIIPNVDLFFRLNMYVIDTDITSAISRDPVEQHTRFTSRLGARYRFN